MKHVSTPWSVETPMDEEYAIVQSGLEAHEWQFIAVCPVSTPAEGGFPRQRAQANAAFIVKAVNGHDALVKALDGMIKSVNYRSGVIAADHVPADMINHADEALERAIVAGRAALQEAGR